MIVGAAIALLAMAYVLYPLFAGTKPERSCPKCGAVTASDAGFCSNCGAQLAAKS